MKGVKPEQSGLLWRLLSRKARAEISRYLSAGELKALGESFDEYKNRPVSERRRIEAALLKNISSVRSIWPGMYGISLLCTAIVLFAAVDLPVVLRIQVFAPIGIGIFGVFALYFLEPWRMRFLFRIPDANSLPGLVVGCLLLVWLIFGIGEREASGALRIARLLLVPLAIGALCAPLAEEILFRELLVRAAGPYTGAGHCFSVVLFAALHMPSDLEMGVLYVLSGAVLAVLRLTSDSLSVPLAAHSLANFIVTMARFY